MTGQEIVDLTKKHTLFEWSAQAKVDPIPVAKAKGIYFWTPEGKRFIDFNSQLMSVNIGHGDERVIQAIYEQAQTLAYANPFMATEPRARLGAKLAEILRATSTRSSLLTAAPRRTRTRSRSHALHRTPQDHSAVSARSWCYCRQHFSDRGSPARPRNPAFPAWFGCSTLITESNAAGNRQRPRWP